MAHRILRRPEVLSRFGCSRSTMYLRIGDGTIPQPIALGPRMVGWPESEIEAVIAARIRGASDDDVRLVVSKLQGARKCAA